MKSPTSKESYIVEASTDHDLPLAAPGKVVKKVCGGARCGFSDTNSLSELARERSIDVRKLWMAMVLCLVFMGAEMAGGLKANSLAVLTDAAHLLSDVVSLAISLFSLWASSRESTHRRSYGFFRVEILGTLVSIQLIWLITGVLVYEAIHRLIHGNSEVYGLLMFIVAAVGLALNLAMAFLLGHSHGHDHGQGQGHSHNHDPDNEERDDHHNEPEEDPQRSKILKSSSAATERPKHKRKKRKNVNVQSAYLHVIGDSILSVGVMIGGAIIWMKPKLRIVGLICTIFFSLVVLATTIRMLRSILEVLIESTSREVDAGKLERGICDMEEVVAVHELHVWGHHGG